MTTAHDTDVRRRGRNERFVIIPKAEYLISGGSRGNGTTVSAHAYVH